MILISDRVWGIVTLWAEARGESFEGQVAVAEVIQRRTALRLFSHGTIGSTVLWPLQFSCWNARDPNRDRLATLDDEDPVVQSVIRAWERAEEGPAVVPGATHYFNPKIASPVWGQTMTVVANLGSHRFVR